ncbi:hypothetical protein ACFSE1_08835 [Rhizobium helianthi]|uniref:Uncharacterized protein n=1 Tax=Rhizobium helianthi TaxID=1132695 RepID=A0ABW4M3P5_9HYPH
MIAALISPVLNSRLSIPPPFSLLTQHHVMSPNGKLCRGIRVPEEDDILDVIQDVTADDVAAKSLNKKANFAIGTIAFAHCSAPLKASSSL